jgi:pilus assembly protein CpaF
LIPEAAFRHALASLLGPVRALLDDPTVSDVLINGPLEVYVERRGRLAHSPIRFPSYTALDAALRSLAQYAGRPLDADHPILEGHLPDGSRVEAIIPPAAPNGPVVAIRRFARERLTIEHLVEAGALSRAAAGFLRIAIEAKRNVLVAGGTGSGKTSLLNALSSFIPATDRVIVMEDARELTLEGEHVVRLLARPGDGEGRGRVTIRDLFHAALRLRPDRLVIGEIRGAEALDVIQAMTSGHGGCLSTLHAASPADALRRLETMALMSGVELPLFALRAQIASAVDLVVQTERNREGHRRVTHVTEVVGVHAERGYELADRSLANAVRPMEKGSST